jgi:hypothetical protein
MPVLLGPYANPINQFTAPGVRRMVDGLSTGGAAGKDVVVDEVAGELCQALFGVRF